MSQSVRQSNLFAAEDFTKIYQSFKNVDFQAYDFDTIKDSLVEYIRENFPEDFNDYIESSEFIAVIELLAYLGTSLAFRTDLNSRENFLDTAQRRESIIRLARMVSYQPKRNIPAEGLFKLYSVSTTETLTDSLGVDLTGRTIIWNDANNPNSYEQIIAIMNAAFSETNTFGKPFKKGTVGGIKTHLYRVNTTPFSTVTYPVTISSEGESYPVDIVNTDFTDGETFFERHPNPENPMHILYRNDNNGLGSADTGFFLHFKQGTLNNYDYQYAFPLENRTEEIPASNINNDDVYVQKVNDNGSVLEEWTQVPSVVGSNIAYNNIALDVKTVYSVISGFNDSITIKYSDGNFGEVPKDSMRVWARTSANTNAVFRPADVGVKTVSMPYIAKSGREHLLTIQFTLETTVSNQALSETTDDIRENAPQVFYTQDRMVNNEDYNVFPLTRGNEIAKTRVVNRTHSGHSRFIDIQDPTGQHSDIVLFAEDGSIYREEDNSRTSIDIPDTITTEEIIDDLQAQLESVKLRTFFYDEYLKQYKTIYGDSEFSYTPGSGDERDVTWVTLPGTSQNDTGYLSSPASVDPGNTLGYITVTTSDYKFIRQGAKLKFVDPSDSTNQKWVTVRTLDDFGIVSNVSPTGPFTLSAEVETGWDLVEVIPFFRTELSDEEKFGSVNNPDSIAAAIATEQPFGLRYDISGAGDQWFVIANDNIALGAAFDLSTAGDTNGGQDASWLLEADYTVNEALVFPVYNVTTRGLAYVFESSEEIRFFFEPEQQILDIETGKALQDEIVLLDLNNKSTYVEEYIYNSLSGRWEEETLGLSFPGNGGGAQTGYITLRERDATPTIDAGTLTYNLANGIVGITATPANGDVITIAYENPEKLSEPVRWNISDTFIMADGYVDQRKVKIVPVDSDEDGVPDNPMAFDELVNQQTDIVYFERFTDFDEYEYFRVWGARKAIGVITAYDASDAVTTDVTLAVRLEILTADGNQLFGDVDLIELPAGVTITDFVDELNSYTNLEEDGGIAGKVVIDENGAFYDIVGSVNTNPGVENNFASQDDIDHYTRIGRDHYADNGEQDPFFYKWLHYAPAENRIDPSISNIQDMLILTQTFYDDTLVWKKESGALADQPEPPTTEELRVQFSDLNNFKMLSDQIVFESAKFKLLFGDNADEQLRANFKVVKLPNATLSDNEIKSSVVDAIDEFFNIANWDFGEAFYYTELAAYIHQQLQKSVASVVIVPTDAESEFGNLFQIRAEVNELFLSTATVNNIDIVKSLTDTNLRIR
jgi:hypothetical protein